MRKLVFIISILFISCSPIKNIFGSEKFDKNDSAMESYLQKTKAKDDNKSILLFTALYANDVVKVVNGDSIVLNEEMQTVPQIGLAGVTNINNNESTYIHISGFKPFKLSNRIRKYKFAYIEKDTDNNQIIVNYSNLRRVFR